MTRIADLTTPIRAKLIVVSYRHWIKPGSKVLDIGCGTGVVADKLSKRLNVKVVGCDIENYLIRRIPFKKIVSASRLPFESQGFDMAMLNDVLHHTAYGNQAKLLTESLRVARMTLIFELCPTLVGKILDYIINKIHNLKMNIPFTYRTEKDWEKLFKKNRLVFEKKKVNRPFYYPFSHVAYRVG